MYRFFMERKRHIRQRLDTSVVVGPLGEGASHPSDDHIGGIVSGTDALLQRLLLYQRREEAWAVEKRQGRGQIPPCKYAWLSKKLLALASFKCEPCANEGWRERKLHCWHSRDRN